MRLPIVVIAILFFCCTKLSGQITVLPTGTNSNINSLAEHNGIIYMAGQDNYLVKTYDQGETLIPLTAPGPTNYLLYGLNVIDTNKLYIISGAHFPVYNYKIFKSNNGGYNWETVFDTAVMTILSLSFIDSNFGIGSGILGKTVVTDDGGATWDYVEHFTSFAYSNSFGDSTIILGGLNEFQYSSNRGKDWNYKSFPGRVSGIHFISQDTFYIIANDNILENSYFGFSYNGSQNIQYFNLPDQNKPVYDIAFDSPSHGYMVGADYRDNFVDTTGIIFETSDHGATWEEYNTGVHAIFTRILLLPDQKALIIGSKGTLVKVDLSLLNTGHPLSLAEKFDACIWPNPFHNNAQIHLTAPNQNFNALQFKLYDLNGKEVKSLVDLTSNQTVLQRSNLPNGLYFYELKNEGKSIATGKVIIQ